jgi:hypothetical protein
MTNRKPLRDDEIDATLDYLVEFIIAIVTSRNTLDVEDAVNLMNRRQEFFDYLKEEFGEPKEDDND